MYTPKVYIVVPVFNRIVDTIRCIGGIRSQDYHNYIIIVVDDGSTDGTYEVLSDKFNDVKVLRGDGNLWWSGSVNLGINYALKYCNPKDYILTLNNDVIVTEKYLRSLVDLSKKYPDSLIGSLACYKDNSKRVFYSGVKWDRLRAKKNFNVPRFTEINKINCEYFKSDTLVGRGLLVPVECFRKIGLFEEKMLPQYAADEDFSLRAKNSGYLLLVSCKGVIISDTKNTGYKNNFNEMNFKKFLLSHFSRKSPNNFKTRFYMCIKHIPIYYCLIYLMIDEIRLIVGFIKKN